MYPTLLEVGDFRIPTYLFALLLGFTLAARLGWLDAKKLGMSRAQYTDFTIWLLIIGVAGSRLMHVLFDGLLVDYVHLCLDPFQLVGQFPKDAICHGNLDCANAGRSIGSVCNPEDGRCYPMQDCFRIFKFWTGGLAVYGGLLACALFVWRYAKRHSLSARSLLDLGSYGIPLGIAIGRLGCFGSGCCYGALCELGLAVRFPVGSPAYKNHYENHYDQLQSAWQSGLESSLGVWPTQLMESALAFAIFLFVFFVLRPKREGGQLKHGELILSSVVLYAIARFSLEFFRADARGELWGLSTSQWIAISLVVLTSVLWKRLRSS